MTLLFVTLLTAFSFSPVTIFDATCSVSQDQFETPLRFSNGTSKFANQCSFPEKFRAAIITNDSTSTMSFANYLHDGKYWSLNVPKNIAIESAFFQIEKFEVVSGIVAAHTQLRFKFKDPKQIVSKSQTSDATTEVTDLIISFEASYPKGNGYNFAIGAFDNYALVGRITSGWQAQNESPKQNIEQYKLSLSAEELRQLFFSAILRSAYLKQDSYYNTLRPNCTTEVFDLLDSLPKQKNKHAPFLTVISNDPIAAPSIQALKERNILERRWANLRAELEDGSTAAPPQEADTDFKILEDIENLPYSLVLFSPEDLGHSEQEKQIIKQAKAMVYEAMPTVMQGLGSAFISAQDKQDILLAVLNKYTQELKAKLKSLQPLMGDKDFNISLYFTPWNTKLGKKIDFKALGVPARLPFEIYEVDTNQKRQATEALYFVNEGTRKIQDISYGDANKKMFFMGAAVSIHLSKARSNIAIQALTGINPQTLPQEVTNEQVKITGLQIPHVTARAERPTFLLTIRQDLISQHPSVTIEFGAEGGITGSQDRFGEFQIFTSTHNCELQKKSAPVFIGTLAEKATGNSLVDLAIKGKNVSFILRSLDLNLQASKVDNMDLLVATWPISCMSNGGINQQFADNVNQMLAEKFSNSTEDSGLVQSLLDRIMQ